MNERLVPFDFEQFKADPSRLRWENGDKAEWVCEKRSHIMVAWESPGTCINTYGPQQRENLRLAAKPPRKVKVRLYHSGYGRIKAISEEEDRDLGRNVAGELPWASDIVEIEVTR